MRDSIMTILPIVKAPRYAQSLSSEPERLAFRAPPSVG